MIDQKTAKQRLSDLKVIAEVTGDIEAEYEWAYYHQMDPDSENMKDSKLAVQYYEKCIAQDYQPMWSRYYLANTLDTEIKDYKRAVEVYEELLDERYADNSDVRGIVYYELGDHYSQGKGVEQDCQKAYEYFTEGNKVTECVDNLVGIGDCYYNGWYVDQDYEKAFDLYNEALLQSYDYPGVVTNCEASRAMAMERIGRCFMYGNGVKQNLEKARGFLEDSYDTYSYSDIVTRELLYLETLEDE